MSGSNGTSASAARLRWGLIAPEFPPDIGGMHTLAHGLATTLASSDTVTVFTLTRRTGRNADNFDVANVLTGRFQEDERRLREREHEIDVWLALNAGVLPLAPTLTKPTFAYIHGNDFLKPWIGYGSWWLEPLRKPYMARLRHALRRAALRRSVPHVRHIFANSRRTAELAADSLGVAPERITICPPGVDKGFFQQREQTARETLRLLTVTRLTKYSARKNVDGVLEALSILNRRFPLRYTVVGDGDDRARLEKLAHDLGVAGQVEFAGRLEKTELLARYRHADLFVLAAKAASDDVEGFGIVYMEASASGVPVICSRAGGAIDAVEPGRNGIVLGSSSPSDIAAGILQFIQTRDQYPPDRVRAVAEAYCWPRVVAPLRDLIREHAGR